MEKQEREDALQALYAGDVSVVQLGAGGAVLRGLARARLLLPGSFNPVHAGHRELLAAAAALHPDKQPAFELSVENPDKGCIPLHETEARAAQFTACSSSFPLVLTRAPLYVDKARLLPGSTFVVGMDTAERLVMRKYYGDTVEGMVVALAEIRTLGCDFLVAGREVGGDWRDDVSSLGAGLPLCLLGLFRALPSFRSNLSSTALRAAGHTLPAP